MNEDPENDGIEQQSDLLIEQMFAQADTLMIKHKNFQQASKLFEKIINVESDNVSAMNGLYYCKMTLGYQDEAYQLLQKAYQIDDQDFETNFNLGLMYLDQYESQLLNQANQPNAQIDEAKVSSCDYLKQSQQHFEKSVNIAKELSDQESLIKSFYNLALIFEKDKSTYQKAIDTYLQIIEIDPSDYRSYINLAAILEKQGNHDECQKYLQKAVQLTEQSVKALTNLGIMKIKIGDRYEGAYCFQQAYEQSIHSPQQKDQEQAHLHEVILINRAKIALESATKYASEYLNEAFEIISKNPHSQVKLALLELCQNFKENTLASELKKLIETENADKQSVKFKLEETFHKQGTNNSDQNDGSSSHSSIHKSTTQDPLIEKKFTGMSEQGQNGDQNLLYKNKTVADQILESSNSSSSKPKSSNSKSGEAESNSNTLTTTQQIEGQTSQSRSVIEEDEKGEDEEDSDYRYPSRHQTSNLQLNVHLLKDMTGNESTFSKVNKIRKSSFATSKDDEDALGTDDDVSQITKQKTTTLIRGSKEDQPKLQQDYNEMNQDQFEKEAKVEDNNQQQLDISGIDAAYQEEEEEEVEDRNAIEILPVIQQNPFSVFNDSPFKNQESGHMSPQLPKHQDSQILNGSQQLIYQSDNDIQQKITLTLTPKNNNPNQDDHSSNGEQKGSNRSKSPNNGHKSRSSLRYSDVERDDDHNFDDVTKAREKFRFFAVQINSPTEENQERIIEHYHVPSQLNTERNTSYESSQFLHPHSTLRIEEDSSTGTRNKDHYSKGERLPSSTFARASTAKNQVQQSDIIEKDLEKEVLKKTSQTQRIDTLKSDFTEAVLSHHSSAWSEATCSYNITAKQNEARAKVRLAKIHFSQKKYQQAIECIKEGLDIVQEQPIQLQKMKIEMYPLLISSFRELDYHQQALNTYDQLIQILQSIESYPKDSQFLIQLQFSKARYLENLKDYRRAILVYLELIGLKSNDKIESLPYLRLAFCLSQIQNYERACNALEHAIRIEQSLNKLPQELLALNLLQAAKWYYHKLNDYSKALQFAQRVLKKDPQNGEALVITCKSLAELFQFTEALENCKKLSRISKYQIDSFHMQGMYHEALQDNSQAIKSYKKALLKDRNHKLALLSLANLLMKLQQYDRAFKYFKHALQFYKDDIEILFGYCLSIFRSYVAFKEIIEQINSDKEVSLSVIANSFYCQDEQNRNPEQIAKMNIYHNEVKEQIQQRQLLMAEAVKHLKQIRQVNPKYGAAIKLLGEIYLKEKKFDRAVQYLKEANSLNPKDSEILVMLGTILNEHGKFNQALKYFKQALVHNPLEVKALICIATAKYEKEYYEDAAKLFEKALKQDERMADVHYDLANTYIHLQQEEKAILHYTKAIELIKPQKRIQYYFNLGNALSLMQRFPEAIIQFRLGVDSLVGSTDAQSKAAKLYFNMGNAHYFMQEFRKAAENYKKALQGEPDNKDFHYNMANTCLELSEHQVAIYHFKKVIELDPEGQYDNTEQALISLAQIYENNMDDEARAHKVYKKLHRLFPENEQAKIKLRRNDESDS